MNEQEFRGGLLKIRACRIFTLIRVLAFAAVSMTGASLFALLVTGTKQIWSSLMIGIGCAAAGCVSGALLLRLVRHPMLKDPTWLMIFGFGLMLIGTLVCLAAVRDGTVMKAPAFVCLGLSGAGGTLSFSGQRKISGVVPCMAEVAGMDEDTVREKQGDRTALCAAAGTAVTVLTLIVFLLVNRRGDSAGTAPLIRWLMLVPLAAVLIGAIAASFLFPLSTHYIEKLRLFSRLRKEGREKPALHRQLKHVAEEPYRQAWLTRFLIAILRPFYRHTLSGTEHIVQDDDNPLVFLGNHAEIYGPIVCTLYFPVAVRTWTISMMMFDRKQVTPYLYENTFSKKTFLPVFVRKGLALFLGWLSVQVMRQLENIPVYKDSPMKLRDTLRQSIEALEAGDNLLIFPESQEGKYQKGGIGKIAPGFVMLAEAYLKKTGKCLRMLPLYANHDERTITFGEIIQYNPERTFREEEERIVAETAEQINRMAKSSGEREEAGEVRPAAGGAE